jgi:cephalosporin hydroxylase
MFLNRLEHKLKRLKFITSSSSCKKVFPSHTGKELESNMVIISQFIESKLLPIVGHSPFPMNEQVLMVATICQLRPTHLFEWGTNIGVSARIFYETCKFFNIDCEIHSIDLPDDHDHVEHPKSNRGKLVKNISKVRLHQGDGVDTAMSLIEKIKELKRPLFFLDGDHQYSSVKRELKDISTKVQNASFLVHDTFFQTEDASYNIGPYLAQKEFAKLNIEKYLIRHTHLGLPGMTALINKKFYL